MLIQKAAKRRLPSPHSVRWLCIDPEQEAPDLWIKRPDWLWSVRREVPLSLRLCGWRLWDLGVGGALERTSLHLGSVLRTWGSVSGLSRSLTKCHHLFWFFSTYFLDLNKTDSKCTYQTQFSPVAQSCPTLCDPMDCSTPGLPVHHQLPEFTPTHVHWVGDAIQPSHLLSSPSPPTTFSWLQTVMISRNSR